MSPQGENFLDYQAEQGKQRLKVERHRSLVTLFVSLDLVVPEANLA